MKYIILRIIAVLAILNLVFVPFLSDENGLIVDEGERVCAYTFMDMIDDLGDGTPSDNDIPIDGLYYILCPICALFVFYGALAKSASACTFGSVAGSIILGILFYQLYVGTTKWYIGISDAHLTFGYYISCVAFIVMLMASLSKEQE